MYRVARVSTRALAQQARLPLRHLAGVQAAPATLQHRADMATEPGKRPSFFGSVLENMKAEYSKNKEMQDSLAKFREDAKKVGGVGCFKGGEEKISKHRG